MTNATKIMKQISNENKYRLTIVIILLLNTAMTFSVVRDVNEMIKQFDLQIKQSAIAPSKLGNLKNFGK